MATATIAGKRPNAGNGLAARFWRRTSRAGHAPSRWTPVALERISRGKVAGHLRLSKRPQRNRRKLEMDCLWPAGNRMAQRADAPVHQPGSALRKPQRSGPQTDERTSGASRPLLVLADGANRRRDLWRSRGLGLGRWHQAPD